MGDRLLFYTLPIFNFQFRNLLYCLGEMQSFLVCNFILLTKVLNIRINLTFVFAVHQDYAEFYDQVSTTWVSLPKLDIAHP